MTNPVQTNGFVSRGNFNVLLDMLEGAIERDFEKVTEYLKKSDQSSEPDSEDDDSLSSVKKLEGLNSVIVDLFDFA